MWTSTTTTPIARWRITSTHDDDDDVSDDNEDDDGDGDGDDDDQVDQQLESAQQLVAQRRSNSPQRPYPVRPKNRVRSQIPATQVWSEP